MEPVPRPQNAPTPQRSPPRRCPRCGKELPGDLLACPDDGAALTAAPVEPAGSPDSVEVIVADDLVVSGELPELGESGEAAKPAAVAEPPEGTGVWEAAVQRDILIGTMVGEYMVRRRIGAGGMGIVYEAEQPQIGRKVAVKILRPDVGRVQGNLVGEARASGRIRHPAIVDVFGYGQIPSIGQYIVMEYLEGRPLDALLEERGALSVPEVLWLLDGVLAGLGAAHAEGVIHRDLKPSNLFVESASGGSQHVKILDFGLAKTQRRDSKAPSTLQGNKVFGTPEYMSPEQVRRQAVSERTDLYALGVIAFELLTGQRPFGGETALEIAVAQVQEQPPRPSEVAPVPEELDALVLQLLEKDPARRPADTATVRREIKDLIQRLGTVTKIGKRPQQQAAPAVRPAARVERPEKVEPARRPAPAAPEPARMRAATPPPASVRPLMMRWHRALIPLAALVVAGLVGGAWSLLGSSPSPAPPAPEVPMVPEPTARVPAPAPETPRPPALEPARPPVLTPRPPRKPPSLPRVAAPASAEPTQEALLERIAQLKLRVQASAPPGGSPDPMMLALLARQAAAARAATDGPARVKVARSLDAFERQFEQSGDLKPR